jgi:hypothetical protein
MAKPIVLAWELTTRAPNEQTWKELSDTDRFNRVAEAGFTFARTAPAETGVRPRGSITKLGITVGWTEEPFTFRAPRWFRIERVFESGPAEKLFARADLAPRPDGGTDIHYRIEVTPRGLLSSAILGIDLSRTTKPKVDKALRALVAALDANAVFDTFGSMTRGLTKEAEVFLTRTKRNITQSPLLDRLVSFLRVGPERDQARIAPQALADAWRVQLDDVIHLLIQATEAGLLSVTLDLLCPACQVPRARFERGVAEVHCEACGIQYDATFPELIAVHFRPSTQLRELAVKVECIGSPGQSPHILAQENVGPGGETDLAVDLRPGMYRLRTLPAQGPPALVEVTDGGGAREAEFRLGAMIHPQLAKVSSPKRLAFKNDTPEPRTAILERVERPPQLVTAGRLLAEFPRFRELAPILPFFSSLELYRAATLCVTPANEPADAYAKKLARAKVAYVSDTCVIAVYPSLGDLLDDAMAAGLMASDDTLQAFAGASIGMVFDQNRDGRVVPMGSAIDEAYAAMQGAGFGRLTLPARFTESRDVMRELAARDLSADPHGYAGADGQALVSLAR